VRSKADTSQLNLPHGTKPITKLEPENQVRTDSGQRRPSLQSLVLGSFRCAKDGWGVSADRTGEAYSAPDGLDGLAGNGGNGTSAKESCLKTLNNSYLLNFLLSFSGRS